VHWGGAEPEFESMEEAQRILNAIMGRNEILHLLQHAPEEFEPIFLDDRGRRGDRCRLG
jgi:hypothetical protein